MKQAIVIDQSMNLSKGKKISQACHASVGASRNASSEQNESWERSGAKKIVLDLGESDFDELQSDAKECEVPNYLVKDAGHTETDPGTVTALGVGPADENLVDNVTGHLDTV